MGNESSLPTDGAPGTNTVVFTDGVEEVEEVVRATPPVSHQPQLVQSGSVGARNLERGQRAGARMIGAVLKSARGGFTNQQHSGSNGTTEDDREKARPGIHLHHSNNSEHNIARADSAGSNYYDASTGSPSNGYVMKGGDASLDYFVTPQPQMFFAVPPAQQQQQQYYPQQGYAQPALQQQQPPVPSTPQVAYHHSAELDVNQKEHPAVSIMYEKTPPQPNKKSIFPGRATARGAALITSMRNLTLAGALRGKKEVNDWEKQWDDDDESDEDGQDTTTTSNVNADIYSKSGTTMPLHQHHQLMPSMDIGHSELPLQHLSHTAAVPYRYDPNHVAVPTPMETPLATGPSNFNKVSSVTPESSQMSLQQNDLATEWDMAGIQPPSALIVGEEETFLTSLQKEPTVDKPNMQMFLPMLRVLGKGSFGKVVLVQKRSGKERGGLFAMKILRKSHLVKRRQIERTRTERKVLSVVNHPFIMKLHYAFQTHDKLFLVLDYCPGGELFFHLSRFRRFPERVARFYAAELLLAIGHLHKRGIIYRDLKPENVLLDADGHVKLGDFGLAKAGIKHPCEGATSMCGTPEYMAPEVLSQAGHGFCVDYWGLGMLLYEMMTGLPPWYTTDRAKLFRRLKSAPLDIPTYFSVQAANCVSALLERNPNRRLGVTGIRHSMEHEFFRNISWKSLYARRVEAPIRPCEGWRPPDTGGEFRSDDKIAASISGAMSLTDIEGINTNDLDAATANFDNTFTRMPVESEELIPEGEESEAENVLNDETFLGFSFDSREREPPADFQRARSHAGQNTIEY